MLTSDSGQHGNAGSASHERRARVCACVARRRPPDVLSFELFALGAAAIQVDQTFDQRPGGLQTPRRIAARGFAMSSRISGSAMSASQPGASGCGSRRRRADRAARRGHTRRRRRGRLSGEHLRRDVHHCAGQHVRFVSAVCVNPRLVMPSAVSRAGARSDALPKSAILICGVPSGADATRMLPGLRSCAGRPARARRRPPCDVHQQRRRRSSGTCPSPPCASAHSARFGPEYSLSTKYRGRVEVPLQEPHEIGTLAE